MTRTQPHDYLSTCADTRIAVTDTHTFEGRHRRSNGAVINQREREREREREIERERELVVVAAFSAGMTHNGNLPSKLTPSSSTHRAGAFSVLRP